MIQSQSVTSDLIGADEVAEILGVSRRTVSRMAKRGALTAVPVGGANVFRRDEVVLLALERFDPSDTPLVDEATP